jgi:hypothetical protein
MAPPKRKPKIKAPQRRHWYQVVLFIFGSLFPPLGTSSHLLEDQRGNGPEPSRSYRSQVRHRHRLLPQPVSHYLWLYTRYIHRLSRRRRASLTRPYQAMSTTSTARYVITSPLAARQAPPPDITLRTFATTRRRPARQSGPRATAWSTRASSRRTRNAASGPRATTSATRTARLRVSNTRRVRQPPQALTTSARIAAHRGRARARTTSGTRARRASTRTSARVRSRAAAAAAGTTPRTLTTHSRQTNPAARRRAARAVAGAARRARRTAGRAPRTRTTRRPGASAAANASPGQSARARRRRTSPRMLRVACSARRARVGWHRPPTSTRARARLPPGALLGECGTSLRMSSEIGWGYSCECAASNAGSIFCY